MTITINGTTGITNDGGYTGDGVSFADTTPANTLVTTTGGNVGIGTSSPASYGTRRTVSVDGAGGTVLDFSVNGTRTATIVTETNDLQIGTITSGPTRFLTNATERARIDSSGNLLVGTTSVFNSGFVNILCNANTATPIAIKSSASAPAAYLIRFVNNSGTDVGAVQMNASNNGVNYITLSDYRLKENIAPMMGALQKVQQLNPCTYTWKEGGYQSQGFIAHELQAVVPECVVGKKDAVDADGKPVYQGIDTSFLVATLTAAIQEQQAIINALTARVEALEGTQP